MDLLYYILYTIINRILNENKMYIASEEVRSMSGFPDIEKVHIILEEIIDEIPKDFFNDLNEGVVLLPKIKFHPKSQNEDLVVLGEYSKSMFGRNIKMYYGSFKRVYSHLSSDQLYEELKETLLHEFTHHLESLAGERGLEIKDEIRLKKYKGD